MKLEFYIRHYGKSFFWAGKFLKKEIFADCAILYAFCRVADDLVDKNTNSKSKIVFLPLPSDDPRDREPDITKAKELLKWEPKVSREDGLIQTIEDVRKQLSSK